MRGLYNCDDPWRRKLCWVGAIEYQRYGATDAATTAVRPHAEDSPRTTTSGLKARVCAVERLDYRFTSFWVHAVGKRCGIDIEIKDPSVGARSAESMTLEVIFS